MQPAPLKVGACKRSRCQQWPFSLSRVSTDAPAHLLFVQESAKTLGLLEGDRAQQAGLQAVAEPQGELTGWSDSA